MLQTAHMRLDLLPDALITVIPGRSMCTKLKLAFSLSWLVTCLPSIVTTEALVIRGADFVHHFEH
jgi:hypothetical protein